MCDPDHTFRRVCDTTQASLDGQEFQSVFPRLAAKAQQGNLWTKIPNNRQVWLDCGLREFCRIDIDLDLVGFTGEIFPAITDLPNAQFASDHQKQIRILDGEVACPVTNRARASTIEGVLSWKAIMCCPRCCDRDLKSLSNLR